MAKWAPHGGGLTSQSSDGCAVRTVFCRYFLKRVLLWIWLQARFLSYRAFEGRLLQSKPPGLGGFNVSKRPPFLATTIAKMIPFTRQCHSQCQSSVCCQCVGSMSLVWCSYVSAFLAQRTAISAYTTRAENRRCCFGSRKSLVRIQSPRFLTNIVVCRQELGPPYLC